MLQRYLKNRLEDLLKARKSSDKGFTLTELLIVIVILGVLAGIVVFAVATLTDDSRSVACETDKRTIQAAVAAYRAEEGTWPANVAALATEGYIAEAPSTTDYTFTINSAVGVPNPGPAGTVTVTMNTSGFTCN